MTSEEIKYDGLTKQEILDLPTIYEGPFDDLKREDLDNDVRVRVWVSRMEFMPDGLQQVTIEKINHDDWEVEEFF